MTKAVHTLSRWNEEFKVDAVRMQRDKLLYSSVLPPIAFSTGRCRITNTDGDTRLELALTSAEQNKLSEIEERILAQQPDSMTFRSSIADGRLEVWLHGDTQFYSADRVLLLEKPALQVDSVVRALVTLPELCYAKRQFGAMWRVEQLWLPQTKFVFDDDNEETAHLPEEDIDDTLPARLGASPQAEPEISPLPPAQPPPSPA